jgi:DNA mismatch endonuclease (patch repair protein)
MPKSRTEYWGPKIEANRVRDAKKRRQLRALGWRVVTVRECEIRDSDKLRRRLVRMLSAGPGTRR